MTKLPDDDLKTSKHVGVCLSVLSENYIGAFFWLIVEVILRNAQCNDEIPVLWIFFQTICGQFPRYYYFGFCCC